MSKTCTSLYVTKMRDVFPLCFHIRVFVLSGKSVETVGYSTNSAISLERHLSKKKAHRFGKLRYDPKGLHYQNTAQKIRVIWSEEGKWGELQICYPRCFAQSQEHPRR